MKTKKVSITQYAQLRGISRQAVLKRLQPLKPMQDIIKAEKIGSTWVLTMKENNVI